MARRVFLTDKEVASVLELSCATLSRILGGFARGGAGSRVTFADREIRLADAKPVRVGGYRRWSIKELASVLGIGADEIEKRLS